MAKRGGLVVYGLTVTDARAMLLLLLLSKALYRREGH